MSKESIVFGGITAKPGEKKSGFTEVMDTGYKFPITVINGTREGKTLLITGGIHGGEYPCIETSMELAQELKPEEICGQVVILQPVNLTGFYERLAYVCPSDEERKNLNRLFPGDKNGTLGDKIAYTITTEYQDKCDFYIDMHGGDIPESLTPYTLCPGVGENKEALDYAYQASKCVLNAKYLLKSSATTGSYNSCAIRGIPSLLIERGGNGLWTREQVDDYKEDVRNVMRFLKIIDEEVKKPEGVIEFTKHFWLEATATGCWYPSVAIEDRVKKGQKLGEIKDVFGNLIVEYFAEYDAIIVSVTTSLGISEGDAIVTYGI
ncbi:MAG: succinylglutamate desuccinylase [Firmicutes bacterium]|nr:succinylglutamate desuccinylase [Bacillota bacterium]